MSSGTVTSTGLGSGLDIESIVEGLVSAEGDVKQSNLETEEAELETELSSVSLLQSALAEFEDSLSSLTDAATFNAVTASVSDDKAFAVETDSDAQVGSYAIEVQQLASAHKLVNTQAYSAGSSGSLTFTQANGNSFTIEIDDPEATLSDIAEAINASSDNEGITATVINTDAGEQLVLTANDSGEDSRITSISSTTTEGDLSVFDYSYDDSTDGDDGLYSQVSAAQDAIMTIDGQTVTSASNEITGVIEGVTFTLTAETEAAASLDISRDTSTVEALINNFVNAYNTLQTTLDSLTSYDSDSEEAASLFGDSMTRTLKNQITRTLTDSYEGSINALSSLGITTQSGGQLEIDEETLAAALDSDLEGVTTLFTAEDGLASTLAEKISSYTADDGILDSRIDSVNEQIEDVEEQMDDLADWLESYEDQLYDKFNAMDTLVASINSEGESLIETLDAITESMNSD